MCYRNWVQQIEIRTVTATRYVTPLREGGSLPAIIEADDDGLYVNKFRGAGQGQKALISELVSGEVGRALGLAVPEIVLVDLDPILAQTEPDPEIQELIRASAGLNLALDYLPGSITFDPLFFSPDEFLASRIVWFDAFVTNVDRTPRNSNLLVWHKKLWLIDHGASLYFHHDWKGYRERSTIRFERIKDHILLPSASRIAEVDQELTALLSPPVIRGIVDLIPEEWLSDPAFTSVGEHRDAYFEFLTRRLASPRSFVKEAVDAQTLLV
jgi:hypothetical protein